LTDGKGLGAAWARRPVACGESGGDHWGIAVEAPVELRVNGAPWTVLMATPTDLEDLTVGLAVTEQVLRNPAAVAAIEVSQFLNDVSVNLVVPESALETSAFAQRSLPGNSSCGLCGLESLAALQQRLHARQPSSDTARDAISDAAVAAAFELLPLHQPMNRATYSTHAAAWCRADGTIDRVREDIGRHNALDKLVGSLARDGRLHDDGFIIMTSRCSYELVYKARATGARLLATISAPTTMALEWAAALALPVVCRTAGGRVVRFPAADAYAQ
jgi:FdhD protein